MVKYSKKAQEKVEQSMHEFKEGTLKSGKGGKGGKVKTKEQAIAIGLSEARKEGAKAPKKSASKKAGTKKKVAKKTGTKKATTKAGAKKAVARKAST